MKRCVLEIEHSDASTGLLIPMLLDVLDIDALIPLIMM